LGHGGCHDDGFLTTTVSETADQHQGIIFFVAHPFLYPLLKARLLPAFLLSAFIISNLFVWTYLPQVAFLALFQRSGSAFLNGTFLVLGEGAAIVAILFESFLAVSVMLSQGRQDTKFV
jgi:hypothetical protein